LFVAGFIGSPSMNLLHGKLDLKHGPAFVSDEGLRLPLRSAPSEADGRACVLGVRPEHLTLGGPLEARVNVTEPTGSETQVFATLAGHRIVGVFRERISAQPGEVLKLSAPPDLIHLFDPVSGQRMA
jgi:multiple sugar transport system ATP-binding protein